MGRILRSARRVPRRVVRRALVVGAFVVLLVTPLVSGVVIARALTDGELARDTVSACATPRTYAQHTPPEIEDCITRAVRRDVAELGLLPALVSMQRQSNRNRLLKVVCHLSIHVIGHDAYHDGVDVEALNDPLELDANWNGMCLGGFIHGYLQEMAEHAPPQTLLDVGRVWCVTLADQNREGCAHGVGHGLARANRNDLRITAAACHSLPRTVRNDCLSGAMMELNMADDVIADRARRNDDGFAPEQKLDCDDVPRDQLGWCMAFYARGLALITDLNTVG